MTSTIEPIEADCVGVAWSTHNRRLLVSAILSAVAAIALWVAAASPDGRDAFYGAIAIEFLIWGAIDALFALGGVRELRRMNALDSDARRAALVAKGHSLVKLLRANHWLNALWLTMGVALLFWGYGVWSGSLVGHGTGVLVQATVLTTLDIAFVRNLSRPSAQ